MLYPQELIDRIIEENNIVDVISQYVKLTKKGSTYFGLCPFHSEKTPSFSVTDKENKHMYYCFGCHEGGSVLTFLMKYENLTYIEAVKELAKRANIPLPEPDYSKKNAEKSRHIEGILAANKEAGIYFFRLLKSQRGLNAYRYLSNRGLTDKTIQGFGLGYSDKYRDDLYLHLKSLGYTDDVLKDTGLFSIRENDTRDLFWNRVMFPIMDVRGRVIGFGGRVMGDAEPKYLNSPETTCFEKSRQLYALNFAKRNAKEGIILCEGYMDVITLHQAGFNTAVASLGTALTEGHAALLRRYTDSVTISYDSDLAGINAALRAIPKLKSVGLKVKVANLSPFKDPDELIKSQGKDEYSRRLKNAMNGLIFEIYCLKDAYILTDPDERTRFYIEAAKKIASLEDEIERENYTKAVSNEFKIDYNLLKDRVKKLALNNDTRHYIVQHAPKDTNKEKYTALNKCQRMILSHLAEDQSFYDKIKDILSCSDFSSEPYESIADELFKQLKNGKVNITAIISIFEDANIQTEAADILSFSFDDNMPVSEIRTALNDSVIRIKKNSYENNMSREEDAANLINISKQAEELNKLWIFGGN